MFKLLKSLPGRADAFLRNDTYYDDPEKEPWVTTSWEDLFDPEIPDPWYTRAYWIVRRNFKRTIEFPGDTCRNIKWAYQRVVRGWDDRAVWSIDWWLDDKMPAMLRQLKEDKHGVPGDMFEGLPVNDEGYHSDPEFQIARQRWEAILDKIIGAFEASRRIHGLTYEDELGPYPSRRPKDVSREDWKAVRHEHFLKSEDLRRRDEKLFEEGMALFAKHYWSLWD